MIRFLQYKDVDRIVEIYQKIDLPKSIFIKSSIEEIKLFVNHQSIVFQEENQIVGFLFLKNRYIDTIVSMRNGVGSSLLKSLNHGVYQTNISFENIQSQKMFSKFNKKFLRQQVVCGELRGRYEITI